MDNTIDKSLQKEVRKHLEWSAQEHSQFIYDCGLAYLENYLPAYPQVVKQIITSKVFWSWWKAHWEKRDQQFLESIDYDPSPILDPVEIYKEHHDPRTLAEAIYLNGQVLQETYAVMITEITDTQTRKHKEEVPV